MTQLLISVTTVKETEIALACGADIIDLKDPNQGALGALPLKTVTEIVTFMDATGGSERKVISATVGDLPMTPELLLESVLALSKTKVDIVKIGFFSSAGIGLSDYLHCLEVLSQAAGCGTMLVAVLFVEHEYPVDLIAAIKNGGFYGVMLDTADKNGATFLDYFSIEKIKAIAQNVQMQGLLFGLAGSLNVQHISFIKEIAPDYVGFRGGVCMNNQRKSVLDSEKIQVIRSAL